MRILVLLAFAVIGPKATVLSAQDARESVSYIRTDSGEKRLEYLARAEIWSDPGEITPEMILNGPPNAWAMEFERLNTPEGLPCEFVTRGQDLGGKTEKFVCRASNGKAIRVKYWEPPGGNREIFGDVASTRLLWALGFDADSVYPVRIKCIGCPQNPFTGTGPRETRSFLGIIEPHFEGTLILSDHDPEEGWSWADLDKAIDSLPPGSMRDRQRTHFDALALLGVFVQHGDRKPSQQRLVCRSDVNLDAGDVHPVSDSEGPQWHLPVLFEKSGEYACTESVVTVQDLGATFGGAGPFTDRLLSKMHLLSWTEKPVFIPSPFGGGCRGLLVDSMTSGLPGEPNPRISEQGRTFLLEQLKRLDEPSIRAIFVAARVDELPEESTFRDLATGATHSGVDAWVKAFQSKVKEIESKSCEPF